MSTTALALTGSQRKEDKESSELGQLFALRFSEILQVLRNKPSSIYVDKDINYASTILWDLDKLVRFIRDKSKSEELREFFACFETTKTIVPADLQQFIDQLRGLEDEQIRDGWDLEEAGMFKKFGDVELLRALFLAFGALQTKKVWGVVRDPSNVILDRYNLYREWVTRPIYIDDSSIQEFAPDMPDAQLFSSLRWDLEWREVGEIIQSDDLVGITEWVVVQILSDEELRKMSKYQRWTHKRRERAKVKVWNQREERELAEKMWEFQLEFDRLSNFGKLIDAEVRRLQLYIMGHIPYIAEVLEYRETSEKSERVKLEISNRKTQRNIPRNYSVRIGKIERTLDRIKRDITRLEERISKWEHSLHEEKIKHPRNESIIAKINSSINTDTAKRTQLAKEWDWLNREKSQLEIKVAQLPAYLEASEEENIQTIASLEQELWELQAKLQSSRLKRMPTREEFRAWIYFSLRAQEFYLQPESPDSTEIDNEWIEKNIVPLFSEIIRDYISLDSLTLERVLDFRWRIAWVDEEYSPDTVFPTDEGISQIQVTWLIERITLPGFMPEDVLVEVPQFQTDMSSWQELPETWDLQNGKKKKKKKSTLREKRIQKEILWKKKTATKQQNEQQIQELHKQLMRFRQFWKELWEELKKRKFRVDENIRRIQSRLPLTGKNRSETRESLEEKLRSILWEIKKVEDKLQWELEDDTYEFQRISNEIGRLRR